MVGIVKWLRHRVVAPVYVGSNPTTHPIIIVGVSPSGKATDSDSVMRRFESCYPSQKQRGVGEMILSDIERRWLEVRFYYFILDLYHIRNNFLDAIAAISAIRQISDKDTKKVQELAATMTSDPYYLPSEEELIILASMNGIKQKRIAEYVGKSQPTINWIIKNKSKNFISYPKLSIKEDEEIKEFFDILEIFKKAGL